MAILPLGRNLVRAHRQQRAWSQEELARRAGVSRAAVSAIEGNRLVPSVAAALSLAAAFACTVEDLFGVTGPGGPGPGWAWPPERTPCRYWHARVRDRIWYYPGEATAAGEIAHDGMFQDAAFVPNGGAEAAATLVLAGCDPAAGILAEAYARAGGFRLLALPRPSRQALALLGDGLIHVAGVHFATEEEPDANGKAARDVLGPGARLLRVARWQEGLAVAPGAGVRTAGETLRAGLRWVGRERGSAARQCQDELLPRRRPPRRLARDHRGVADAVRGGWADVGVCHRLVSEEAGLRFFSVRQERYDLCYRAESENDPRLQALLRVVRSSAYRRLLAELPGYDPAGAGEVQSVN